MSPVSTKDQDVWIALEGLRESEIVRDARAYAKRVTETRERRRRFWDGPFSLSMPRAAVGALAAAGIAAAVMLWPSPGLVRTDIGETRTTTLADGSTIMLNTDTRIEVAFTDGERRVRLLQGQARFDVAHDRTRPFRVSAGSMVVTAVGTAFDVAALPRRTTVTLIEGKVVVQTKSKAKALSTTLAPGQQLAVADGIAMPKHAAKLESALAWQRNQVDLNDLTLAEALAEVNRYSETKVVVRTASLQDKRVSGVFRTGDVEAVAAALRVYFGLDMVLRTSNEIILDRAG